MHVSDSQCQTVNPPAATLFPGLLDALQRKAIAVQRDLRHAHTLFINPACTAEVVDVVKLCSRTHTPISVCYGSADAVDVEPRVYLNLQRLASVEALSESRYLVGLGATAEQLRGLPLAALIHADGDGLRSGECLGHRLLCSNLLSAQALSRHIVGLVAVLPDGQLWMSLRDQQQGVTEPLLNRLFLAQSRASLSVLLALELETCPERLASAAQVMAVPQLPQACSVATTQIIAKLKVALDPNRILNPAQPSRAGDDALGEC